jgi:hypothetical protein
MIDAHAHVHRLVSVVKMATIFEGCTIEKQRSLVRFLWAKGVSAKYSVFRVKRFTTESRNSLKGVRKSQMMPNRVRKWLRLESTDIYVEGFDALVKRWEKCINVGGGYVEK